MTSLYIHIPFCRKKCFYCSFIVVVAQLRHADLYLDALSREARPSTGTLIRTLYLGGGTPTLIDEQQLGQLMAMVRSVFDCSSLGEITIEANPEDITKRKAAFLKGLGVNRVSLGVQTFHDRYLGFLGRSHNSQQARQAFDDLRAGGFDNITIDMMFALPGQTREELRKDLGHLIALQPDHVSYYALTVEKPSRFDVQRVNPVPETRQASGYALIVDFLNDHGLRQYEVSNFAALGKASQHNLNYWQGGDYIGLGVSAHSHRAGFRSWNVGRLKEYIARLQEDRDPTENFEILTPEQRLREALTFGLRMNEGIVLVDLEERYQVSLDASVRERIQEFVKGGFLDDDEGRIRPTPKGRIVLDEMASYLI